MNSDENLKKCYLAYKKIGWRIKARIKRIRVQLLFWTRIIKQPQIPENEDGKQLIHIGCGEINSPEFINIDARPFPHVHFVTANITDLSMFSDDSIDLIYMSHVLEHVKIRDVGSVLWEMNRALKKGGILRISVPDFDRLIEIYDIDGDDIKSINFYLMGNQDYDHNYHKSIYNRNYLSNLMIDMGFSDVREWDPNNCTYHNFKDDATAKISAKNGKEYLISLNLEGIK